MRKLNKKGYLTIEIILGSVIAFAIAFFLIEITAKMISNNDDTFRDTIITTDNALIISGVKEVVENNKDGINNISCNDNNICTITYFNDDNIGTLKIEDNTVKYEKVNPNDTTIGYDRYEKELDSSLSDIKLTSNITGEVTDESNIYFKITGKNIFLDKEYNIIIPIDNLKKENVCNIPSVTSSTNLVNYITTLYNDGEKEVVTNNNIEYNTVSCLGLMNDRLGGTTPNYDAGNIRYYGENPNNYIYFNCDDIDNQSSSTCELWRIIGVFEDEGNAKVKIIRNENIGKFSFDNSFGSTGMGVNNWATSRLMKMLNPISGTAGIGDGLYWNRKNGTCYTTTNYETDFANQTKNCDMSNIGLKESTKSFISKSTWYLGGEGKAGENYIEDSDPIYEGKIYSADVYKIERGTKVYSGRPTTWTGNIALPYPSDFGYAADFKVCAAYLRSYDSYDSLAGHDCLRTNWMRKILNNSVTATEGDDAYLLTPNSSDSHGMWFVYGGGNIWHPDVYACSDLNVVPTLYLRPGILVKSGNGSIDNPYQIDLNLV